MVEGELQLAPMHRIIKKAGAERVSEDGSEELRKILEKIGIKISKEAILFAVHAGRKTVKSEDIQIAAKRLMNEEI
jgi:DNA-binding protein